MGSIANSVYKVGVIVGSVRTKRAGPQIADFIHETLKQSTNNSTEFSFEVVDVSKFNLPLYGEEGVPKMIADIDGYSQETTKIWSRKISSLDAFVFVTPEYNYCIPAGLKNSIDSLYNEWKGKPAMVVSYGGGGGKSAWNQLAKLVLTDALEMRVATGAVNLVFPQENNFFLRAATGQELGLNETDSTVWKDQKAAIESAWQEVAVSLKA